MPAQSKKIDDAEEEEDEDETYEPNSESESETEESVQDEEEEIENERFIVSDDEEEVSSEAKIVKGKKNLAQEAKHHTEKKGSAVKRKASTSAKSTGKKVKKSVDVKKKGKSKPVGSVKKKISRKKTKDGEEEMEVEIDDESVDGKKKGDGEKKTPKLVEFNDKNVDYNLYNEAPEHIKQMKVKLSSNILMFSRMIEASSGSTAQGLSYDYAALSFQRNTKTGKAYEFNLPLSLAPTVIKGIQFLIKNNPKFFEKHLPIIPKAKENEGAE